MLRKTVFSGVSGSYPVMKVRLRQTSVQFSVRELRFVIALRFGMDIDVGSHSATAFFRSARLRFSMCVYLLGMVVLNPFPAREASASSPGVLLWQWSG